jgi:AraC family transcriptional regulator of adaptative response/methylated-DNA-[protein]-cysteine methyltransferase
MSQKIDKKTMLLKSVWIDTVLGPMIAMADDAALYLLEFAARKGLEREMDRLRQRGFTITPGHTSPLASIEAELKAYFEGNLTQFKTPYRLFGSSFQQQVWQALCQIPYGETRSYAQQSASIGKPSGYRAVANANGANQLAIVIPCHRVIASDGSLGGYGGGLAVKEWLLEHEKRCS